MLTNQYLKIAAIADDLTMKADGFGSDDALQRAIARILGTAYRLHEGIQ